MLARGLTVVAAALSAAAVAVASPPGKPPSAEPAPESELPPVVMIIFDEFPVDSLLGLGGEIDARRFPNFARLADLSTWFPNAQSVFDSTETAVPAVLSGNEPNIYVGSTWRDHPQSVFTYMDGLGYEVDVREEVTTVCPPRICERTRDYGSPRPNIRRGRAERLDEAIRSLRGRRAPAFTFRHVLLPHVPWAYLPSGRRRPVVAGGTLPEFGAPIGFHDRFLTQHNEQRYLLQLGFVDRELGKLLRRLRRQGLLRRSLLVVTADHGLSFEVGADSRRAVDEGNVHEIAPVPLFIKRPGQLRGAVNTAYARTTDVLPTIARLLGSPLEEPVDGTSAFGPGAGARPGVRIVERDYGHTIEVGDERMTRRRKADVARRIDTFGTGPWRRVFEIGPHRRLLGRRVSDYVRSRATGARARFAAPGRSRYEPRSGVAPVWVAGRIRGRAAKGGRDLAVGVNGRIRAVARSFRLRGRRGEWFSAMIPEAVLRKGANRIELFEVAERGRRLVLRRLGRSR